MFTKGIAKIGGRKKGTPNKLTSTFREAVLLAYENIGGHEAFSKWASENQTEFYRIAARLIPTEITTTGNEEIRVIVQNVTHLSEASIKRFPRTTLPELAHQE